MKKAKKYNIIIYTCLIVALILLALGGRDYLKDKNKDTSPEIKITEEQEKIKKEERELPKAEEPENLKNVDIHGTIKKYLDSLQDQIQKNKKITSKMISSWGDYTIEDIEYQREISTKYYEYKANIVITNKDAKLPCDKNKKLSTEEKTVLTVYFDIADSERTNGFLVKNVDFIE